jgi:hypothetical protein
MDPPSPGAMIVSRFSIKPGVDDEDRIGAIRSDKRARRHNIGCVATQPRAHRAYGRLHPISRSTRSVENKPFPVDVQACS